MGLPKNVTDNPSDAYYIINKDDKCVHLHDAKNANGAVLTLWDRVDQPNVQWFIRPSDEAGYYNVVSKASGRAIHNQGGGRENNAPCTTWDIIAQDNLKIRFEEVGPAHPGYYYLIFKDSGKCVHNEGDRLTNGSPITQWDKVPHKNVMWRFEGVGSEHANAGHANAGHAGGSAATPGEVVITHVQYRGEVKRVQSDEYVEITNRGGSASDISGWSLDAGDSGQHFTFPAGTVLAPGQKIRVYTNQVNAESGGFSFGSGRAIWNDKGDVAKLADASGKDVSKLGYGEKAGETTAVKSAAQPAATPTPPLSAGVQLFKFSYHVDYTASDESEMRQEMVSRLQERTWEEVPGTDKLAENRAVDTLEALRASVREYVDATDAPTATATIPFDSLQRKLDEGWSFIGGRFAETDGRSENEIYVVLQKR